MTKRAAAAFVLLAGLAALFRFPELALRPMHCDEAVNADQLGVLLEQGRYQYTAQDFHGPTLEYLSLVFAKAAGIRRYVDLSETLVRMVPALLGVLLVAAQFLMVPYLGLRASAMSALFTAVSPVMVYFSRYYIHEMLLVLLAYFALIALFGYLRTRRAVWAMALGLLAGLIYATKETVVVVAGCMFLAGLAAWLTGKREAVRVPVAHLALAAMVAAAVAALFLSSFLTYPRGVMDSLTAFGAYFMRAAGLHTVHLHPWNYYLQLLLFFHQPGKPVWSEGLILAAALAGAWAAFSNPKSLPLRFLASYALFLLLIYSAIPYKAPWNILGFVQVEIMLAGAGVAWLFERFRSPGARYAIIAAALIGIGHLGWLAWTGSTRYGADPANPWVYAHTSTDVFSIVQRVESLAAADPRHYAVPVQVISAENLWPLPWYFRRFTNIGWAKGVPPGPAAPLILATPDREPAITHKLYEEPPPGHREMYMNAFDRYVELRPNVEIRGYAVKDLWDAWQQRGAAR